MGTVDRNIRNAICQAFETGYLGSVLAGGQAADVPAAMNEIKIPKKNVEKREPATKTSRMVSAAVLEASLNRRTKMPKKYLEITRKCNATEPDSDLNEPQEMEATIHREELTALVTLMWPLKAPPRQFCIPINHIDLQWIEKLNCNQKAQVSDLTLLNMPEDIFLPKERQRKAKTYTTASGDPVLLNSPRSVLIVLRRGIDPAELQKRHFTDELRSSHYEERRLSDLAKLQNEYKSMIQKISFHELLGFFRAYNPSEPSVLPNLDVFGETNLISHEFIPGNGAGAPCQSSVDVDFKALRRTYMFNKPKNLSVPLDIQKIAHSNIPPVPDQTDQMGLHSSRARAQQERNDPAFQVKRIQNVCEKMNLRPLLAKMNRTRDKLVAMALTDTNRKLGKLMDRQHEQEKRLDILSRHRDRRHRVEDERRHVHEARQMLDASKVKRREIQLQQLQRKQVKSLQEKEEKEKASLRHKAILFTNLLARKKQRREIISIRLQDRVASAKDLEQAQLKARLENIDQKEKVIEKVTQRKQDMQRQLKEQGALRRQLGEAKKAETEVRVLETELARKEQYEEKFSLVETRLESFKAQKQLTLNEKTERETRAAAARRRVRDERLQSEQIEQEVAAQEYLQREVRFQERQQSLSKQRQAASLVSKLKFEDRMSGVSRRKARDEFRHLCIHDNIQRKSDRVETLSLQLGVLTEKTRKERESILVEKQQRQKALNELAVKAEKELYFQTCKDLKYLE